MTINKKKKLLYVSSFFFMAGVIVLTIVAYFLIQSIRESFYQNSFEKKYEFISLEEDGDVYPVQVFHGVKVNTFLQEEEETGKKSGKIIFEVKDEPKAKLEGFNFQSEPLGMSAYANMIQYKKVVENETGKESFIISMQMTPNAEKLNRQPIKYRTYSINENGVIKESNFTIGTKSKLETQWIRGLSGEKWGFYTNLPYQKGGTLSLIVLNLLGILFIVGGVGFRRRAILTEQVEAA
jgi:hypothetical protein